MDEGGRGKAGRAAARLGGRRPLIEERAEVVALTGRSGGGILGVIMGRRSERAGENLADAAGEALAGVALSGPIGCAAVGALLVAVGLYLRHDASTL